MYNIAVADLSAFQGLDAVDYLSDAVYRSAAPVDLRRGPPRAGFAAVAGTEVASMC